MPVTVLTNNPTTSTSRTPGNNQTPLAFSAADFQRWNQTTSVVHLPAKLVGKDKIPTVRGDLIKSIGEKKVAAVQALSATKFRIQFTSSSYRHERDVNGIHFRGVTLTPHPAYEEVKSVFVDRAPLQMPDQYLFELLAPYGRVLSVEHLKVRGFSNVKSGTRRVSMVINHSIPAIIKIGGFQLAFRYRGQPPYCFVCQEVGHTAGDCPKSRKAKTPPTHIPAQGLTNNGDTSCADHPAGDLRHKLNQKAGLSSLSKSQEVDLRVKLDTLKDGSKEPCAKDPSSSSSPPLHVTQHAADKGETSTTQSLATTSVARSVSELGSVAKAPRAADPSLSPSLNTQSSHPTDWRDTLKKLREVFKVPESVQPGVVELHTIAKPTVEKSFLTTSTAAQSTVSARPPVAGQRVGATVHSLSIDMPSTLVKHRKKLYAATGHGPARESFDFSKTPVASRKPNQSSSSSTWTQQYCASVSSTVETTVSSAQERHPGVKGRDDSSSSENEFDVALTIRSQRQQRKRRRHFQWTLASSSSSASASVEMDSVEECLKGESVVDPIAPPVDESPQPPVLQQASSIPSPAHFTAVENAQSHPFSLPPCLSLRPMRPFHLQIRRRI